MEELENDVRHLELAEDCLKAFEQETDICCAGSSLQGASSSKCKHKVEM